MRSILFLFLLSFVSFPAAAQQSGWSLDASTHTGRFLGNTETFANLEIGRTTPAGWSYGARASALTSSAGWENDLGEYEEAGFLWEAGPYVGYRQQFRSDAGFYVHLSAGIGHTDYRRNRLGLGRIDNRGRGPGLASLGQEVGIWFRPNNRMRVRAGTSFNQGYAFHAGTWVNRGPMFRAGVNFSL